MKYTDTVLDFITQLEWSNLPDQVRHQSKRCLMDTLGALIAGFQAPVINIVTALANGQFQGEEATILVKGAKQSASGAALVNGFAINALDIDDGYRDIKGHPGACILPVLLASAEKNPKIDGKSFLTSFVVGYELAIRAGLIRHATYETYHSSGSWGAIGGAATAGKIMGLSKTRLSHALGIAEYHAPIAPMMKCIETPGMGKDSIGWGCMVAVMSVLMAESGFTGIRTIFEDSPIPDWICSLGSKFEIMNLYFKPYAACRWAQPAIDGTLKIINDRNLKKEDIRQINVFTFKESAALNTDYPKDTEQAQYNIAFPIAAAVKDNQVGPEQVLEPGLFDKEVHRIMDKINIIAQDRFQREFPNKAESEVEIITKQDDRFVSGTMSARWDPHTTFPTDTELEDKFLWLVTPVIGKEQAMSVKRLVWNFDQEKNINRLIDLTIRKKEG